MLRLASAILFALPVLLAGIPALAAQDGNVSVTHDGITMTFRPYATVGSVAAGDLGGDGTDEIIVGAGKGLQPLVGVFRQDGSSIGEFLAYDKGFTGGVNVAVCDVEGDGTLEIVTGAGFGGGPHVRIFDNMGQSKYDGFFAYAEDFRGGVNVACGDVDGVIGDEIVTGAGLSGGPHLKVLSYDGTVLSEVFDGHPSENIGAYVRVEDGVVYTSAVGGDDLAVHAYALAEDALSFVGSSTEDDRATYFATASVNDGTVTADVTTALFRDTSPKYILVDVSEQRLYAYEYGIPVNTFLISSGVYGMDTPIGKTSVLAKLPVHDYGGPGYWLPNTKWNLRFRPHYYIHSAYWHNNFGHRMSHGCVNVSIPDAEWVYNWADIGTPVEVQE